MKAVAALAADGNKTHSDHLQEIRSSLATHRVAGMTITSLTDASTPRILVLNVEGGVSHPELRLDVVDLEVLHTFFIGECFGVTLDDGLAVGCERQNTKLSVN